jgi:phosphoglycerate dehydrogenase-like enzyme
MARWTVLVTAPRLVAVLDRYVAELHEAECATRVAPTRERLTEAELLPLVGDIDGFICGDDQITARVLDAARRLKVISKWGTGIDSIDVEEARRRGIAVRNTPGAFTDPVADTVLGYLLLVARQLDRHAADMRAGLWQRLPARALGETTIGIVGLGAIGMAVARRAAAFGARLLGSDAQPRPLTLLQPLGLAQVPLETLLAQSDFVTLHASLTADSDHLIDDARLRLMKPSAVLINTARGRLVDEQALVAALREGRLAGAALDVFEDEPLPETSPLRLLPNVYLSPHNANASQGAAERVHVASIRNVLQVLNVTTTR